MCYNIRNRYTVYPLYFGEKIMKSSTCCFFGHRTINETEELKSKIIEIIEKSKDRRVPICPFYYECGGCNLLHIKYLEQLKMKTYLVESLFFDTFNKYYKVNECLGMKDGLSYLTFDGLENYKPFSLKENITNDNMYFVMIEVDEDGQFVQEAYLMEMDSSWVKEEGYYSSRLEVDSLLFLGVPTFDEVIKFLKENSYEL